MTEIEAAVISFTSTRRHAAHRFFGMGFALGRLQVEPGEPGANAISGRFMHTWGRVLAHFRCVCGREEIFQMRFDCLPMLSTENLFESLAGLGSLSREHLLADGYSVQQIDEMEARLADYSARYLVPAGPAGWHDRKNRMPPVPGLAEDFALRLLRDGGYVRLPERPKPLKFLQRHGDEIARLLRDPSVQAMSREVRAPAALDPDGGVHLPRSVLYDSSVV